MDNKIEALKLIADAVDYQKKAMESVKELLAGYTLCGIDCDPDNPRLHLYDGIQEFADTLGKKITTVYNGAQYNRLSITYNGVEVFQLVERGKEDDLSDQ